MIVGEAAACLSEEIRGELPEIPWREIKGFRNQAVHAYFGLDWAIVWEVADVDIPELARRVLALVDADYPEIAKALHGGTNPADAESTGPIPTPADGSGGGDRAG